MIDSSHQIKSILAEACIAFKTVITYDYVSKINNGISQAEFEIVALGCPFLSPQIVDTRNNKLVRVKSPTNTSEVVFMIQKDYDIVTLYIDYKKSRGLFLGA